MDAKSTIIEKLLSEEENVPKISAWVSCTEDGGGAMARCSYDHEELKEILISQPEEKFKELLYELGVDVDDTTIPPPHGHQHQSLEDDFAEPGTALEADPNNAHMLPPAHEPGPQECVDCLEREKEISELEDRCRQLEKELRSSQHQKAQESQERAASDWKRKGQIMEEKNKEMEKLVTAMRRQIEKLKIKNTEIENTLQALQEKSEGDKENDLRIINYFRQVMRERKKKIEELEAENQMLQNKEPPDQNWCELYEKLVKLEEEQLQLEVQMKTNSELLAGAIKNNEELKQENQLLKEGMEEKEEEFRKQLAIQLASYASREAVLARKVNEEVRKLQQVYEDLSQFATRQGILNLSTLNNETE